MIIENNRRRHIKIVYSDTIGDFTYIKSTKIPYKVLGIRFYKVKVQWRYGTSEKTLQDFIDKSEKRIKTNMSNLRDERKRQINFRNDTIRLHQAPIKKA